MIANTKNMSSVKNSKYLRQAQYKKGFASFALIAIIVVLVAIGGYFAWSKKPNQHIENKSLLTEVSSPTADWKTYTNTKYGYEIKYPKDFTLSYPAGSPCSGPIEECGDLEILNTDIEYYPVIGILVDPASPKTDKITLKEYMDHYMVHYEFIEAKYETIGGEPAYSETEKITNPDANELTKQTVVSYKNNFYQISYTEHYGSIGSVYSLKDWENVNLFNQMLSTFKFTQ